VNELHLFAGAGGGILGGMLLGHTCVCAVEWDKHARNVLLARQRDGCLPKFPIWDDVQTFDGTPWRGRVDIVCGGFPCQDISAAGKGAGIDGKRSGMWFHMARIIGEIRPRFVLVENSPVLTSRGLGRVLGDLAALGYDACWGVLGAADVGAPHQRDRIWIVGKMADAHGCGSGQSNYQFGVNQRASGASVGEGFCTESCKCGSHLAHAMRQGISERGTDSANAQTGRPRPFDARAGGINNRRNAGAAENGDLADAAQVLRDGGNDHARSSAQPCTVSQSGDGCGSTDLADANGSQRQGMRCTLGSRPEPAEPCALGSWWERDPAEAPESGVGRMAHGVASRLDRLRCIGNGQVPAVAAIAFRILSERLSNAHVTKT
jgi:DNA (cytosine-5)-methyltransferase 1